MNNKYIKSYLKLIIYLTCLLTQDVKSDPTSSPGKIISITQLDTSTYIVIDNTSICATNTFWLQGDFPGAKQILALATTAFIAGKVVQIQVRTDIGCTGWGSKVAGITVAQ